MAEEILEKNKSLKIAFDGSPASSPSLHSSISPIATAVSFSKLNPDAPAFVPRSSAAAPPPASYAPSPASSAPSSASSALQNTVNSNQRGPDRAGRSNQRGRGQSDGTKTRGGRGRPAGSNQIGRGRSAGSNRRGATTNWSTGLNQRGGRANRSGGYQRGGAAKQSSGPKQGGGRSIRSDCSNRKGAKRPPRSKQRGAKRPSTYKLLPDEKVKKITNKVEYYFSDINLATTEQLMKFIRMDQERQGDGFVPISVVASFKEIKALVSENPFLAYALRTSSKLVVSETGKRVKRTHPINNSILEEVQARIVVAENLPTKQYKGLNHHFSSAGSVKAIRICHPQNLKDPSAATNKEKPYMYLRSKLHAFVEYQTVKDAQNALSLSNDENSESGLRVCLLQSFLSKQGPEQEIQGEHEGDGNKKDDASTSNQEIIEIVENAQQSEPSDVPASKQELEQGREREHEPDSKKEDNISKSDFLIVQKVEYSVQPSEPSEISTLIQGKEQGTKEEQEDDVKKENDISTFVQRIVEMEEDSAQPSEPSEDVSKQGLQQGREDEFEDDEMKEDDDSRSDQKIVEMEEDPVQPSEPLESQGQVQGREEECKDDEKNEDVLFTPEQTIDEMEEDSVRQSES